MIVFAVRILPNLLVSRIAVGLSAQISILAKTNWNVHTLTVISLSFFLFLKQLEIKLFLFQNNYTTIYNISLLNTINTHYKP